MNKAVILLGTNTGELQGNLEKATGLVLELVGEVMLSSKVYRTAAWGNTDQPDFFNQVIDVYTGLSARELMDRLLEIELSMGRRRMVKWEPRIIDLDILFFNEEVIHEKDLEIPHPRLHERRFTLVPLVEILPGFMHPVLKKTCMELLGLLTDNLNVEEAKS